MDNHRGALLLFLAKHHRERFTVRRLSLLLGVPYATLYRLVLNQGDDLFKERVGTAITLGIDCSHPLVKHRLIIAADEERQRFLKNSPLLRAIAETQLPQNHALVLFGSEAKRTAKERSDVDLLVLNKDGKKTVSFLDQELFYKRKINPIFLTLREFTEMLGAGPENVGKQILSDHVILHNPELFWGVTVATLRDEVPRTV